MYLKDMDHIIRCWVRIKEIPKIQQLKIKFKNKNVEKSGKVVRFFLKYCHQKHKLWRNSIYKMPSVQMILKHKY